MEYSSWWLSLLENDPQFSAKKNLGNESWINVIINTP